jgi:hypothetical protein
LLNIYVTNITVYTCIDHQFCIAVVAGWYRSGFITQAHTNFFVIITQTSVTD